MINNKLKKQVIAGLMGLTVLYGSGSFMQPTTAEAAAASLYNQYQAEQRLKKLKEQVAKAQQEIEQQNKNEKRMAAEAENVKADESAEDNAVDFATKIQNILKNYHANEQANKNPFAKPVEITVTKENDSDSQMAESAMPQPVDADTKTVYKADPPPAKPALPIPATVQNAPLIQGTYNFDWRGTPLAQSIYSVAKIAGKGVVVNGDIKGSVYMSLKQVSCNQALDYLANAFGINWMSDGNNIIVSTGDLMKQSRVYQVSYANKDKLKDEIKSMGVAADNIYANNETGTLSVTGTPYQLAQVQKRVNELDHPVTRCLILAQLIEIDHGKSLDLGMTYSLPTYSHTASTDNTTDTLHGNWIEKLTFSASSQANRALSKGRVIARPLILTMNGQKGTANFGDRVPVLTRTDTGSSNTLTVTYQDIGTKLEVTPIVNGSTGMVTMAIDTEVSNITGWVSSGDTRAPQMSTRKATTSTYVKSGQSFVIGGLMIAKELDNLSGIPGLMNLPILGRLFSYHSRSKEYAEVYIMITPFIVDDDFDTTKVYNELAKIDEKNRKAKTIEPPAKDWASGLVK